jgi:hypothetical protein
MARASAGSLKGVAVACALEQAGRPRESPSVAVGRRQVHSVGGGAETGDEPDSGPRLGAGDRDDGRALT